MRSCKEKRFSLHAGMNRDSKTKGGIVGISHEYNAIEKWAMTAHLRAAIPITSKISVECKKREMKKN